MSLGSCRFFDGSRHRPWLGAYRRDGHLSTPADSAQYHPTTGLSSHFWTLMPSGFGAKISFPLVPRYWSLMIAAYNHPLLIFHHDCFQRLPYRLSQMSAWISQSLLKPVHHLASAIALTHSLASQCYLPFEWFQLMGRFRRRLWSQVCP